MVTMKAMSFNQVYLSSVSVTNLNRLKLCCEDDDDVDERINRNFHRQSS
jgi:hypothetical protein